MQATSMSLRNLKRGQTVQVARFNGVSDGLRHRLLELGMTCGSRVTVCGEAPLGDPIVLEVKGCRLALRKKEAEGIEVTPV